MKTNNIRKLSKKVISGNSRLINNKKAVSQVITSVLIILLVISAVAILSFVINNAIKNQLALSPKTSCLEMQFSPPVSIEKACYNKITNGTELTIKRNLDEELKINDITFILDLNSGSNSFVCGNSCENCQILKIAETKTYYFNFNQATQKPTEASVKINNCLIETKNIANC